MDPSDVGCLISHQIAKRICTLAVPFPNDESLKVKNALFSPSMCFSPCQPILCFEEYVVACTMDGRVCVFIVFDFENCSPSYFSFGVDSESEVDHNRTNNHRLERETEDSFPPIAILNLHEALEALSSQPSINSQKVELSKHRYTSGSITIIDIRIVPIDEVDTRNCICKGLLILLSCEGNVFVLQMDELKREEGIGKVSLELIISFHTTECAACSLCAMMNSTICNKRGMRASELSNRADDGNTVIETTLNVFTGTNTGVIVAHRVTLCLTQSPIFHADVSFLWKGTFHTPIFELSSWREKRNTRQACKSDEENPYLVVGIHVQNNKTHDPKNQRQPPVKSLSIVGSSIQILSLKNVRLAWIKMKTNGNTNDRVQLDLNEFCRNSHSENISKQLKDLDECATNCFTRALVEIEESNLTGAFVLKHKNHKEMKEEESPSKIDENDPKKAEEERNERDKATVTNAGTPYQTTTSMGDRKITAMCRCDDNTLNPSFVLAMTNGILVIPCDDDWHKTCNVNSLGDALAEPENDYNRFVKLKLPYTCTSLSTLSSRHGEGNQRQLYIVCCLRGGTVFILSPSFRNSKDSNENNLQRRNQTTVFQYPTSKDDAADGIVRYVHGFAAGYLRLRKRKQIKTGLSGEYHDEKEQRIPSKSRANENNGEEKDTPSAFPMSASADFCAEGRINIQPPYDDGNGRKATVYVHSRGGGLLHVFSCDGFDAADLSNDTVNGGDDSDAEDKTNDQDMKDKLLVRALVNNGAADILVRFLLDTAQDEYKEDEENRITADLHFGGNKNDADLWKKAREECQRFCEKEKNADAGAIVERLMTEDSTDHPVLRSLLCQYALHS